MPQNQSELTDAELVHLHCTGDTSAFSELYERYAHPIFAYVMYRVSERTTAEDITSTVFMRALEHTKKYNPNRGSYGSWIYRIARNALIDHFRRNRTTANLDDFLDSLIDPGLSPAEHVVARERASAVHTALYSLSEIQREILLLRFWDDCSFTEIAKITGKSEAGCKMQLRRSLDTLRTHLPLATLILFLTTHTFQ